MSNTEPFEAETSKPIDSITEAKLALLQRFEQTRRDTAERFHAEAIRAYEVEQARARGAWIAEWKHENEPVPMRYPYAQATDAEVLRAFLLPEIRLDGLLKAGCYSEALKVFLMRHAPRSRARVAEVQEFFAPWFETSGAEEVTEGRTTCGYVPAGPLGRSLMESQDKDTFVHGNGISEQLKRLITRNEITTVRGIVRWITSYVEDDRPGTGGESKPVYAHQQLNEHKELMYPPDEF